MIAIVVITVAVGYLILILLALILPKTWAEKFLYTGIALTPLIWKTWDMPIGYINYRMLCQKEAGLHVIQREFSPAKILRFPANLTEEDELSRLLKLNENLQAIEAGHPRLYFADIYVRYRLSTDAWQKLYMEAEDTVTGYPGSADYSVIKMDSSANYKIIEETENHAFRSTIQRVVLLNASGARLATFGWVIYGWTVASNTLFGRAISSSCSDEGRTSKGYERLLALVDVKF